MMKIIVHSWLRGLLRQIAPILLSKIGLFVGMDLVLEYGDEGRDHELILAQHCISNQYTLEVRFGKYMNSIFN